MAVFEYLHLALSVPPIGPLFERDLATPTETRTEFLTELFSDRIDFFHRGTQFAFVPAPTSMLGDRYRAGFIGRQSSERVNAGPEALFKLTPHHRWHASFLCIDLAKDQQIVAVERRADVGSTHSVLQSLVDQFTRDRKATSWHVDIEFVTRAQAFRDAAKEHLGRITSLEFEFNPANALRGFDEFKELDKLARAEAHAQKSEYTLKNRTGAIQPEGRFIDSAIAYAHEGAGRVIMREGRRVIYDSRRARKTKDIPESLMPRESEETKIAGATLLLHRLFEPKTDAG